VRSHQLTLLPIALGFVAISCTSSPPHAERVPDGVVCAGQVCPPGTVCCDYSSCKKTVIDPGFLGGPVDAGSNPSVCNDMPYLACDGPEDCPDGTVCCYQDFLQLPHTACEAAQGTTCNFFEATVCHSDSDCQPPGGYSSARCKPYGSIPITVCD